MVRKGDIYGNNAKTKNYRNVASLSVRFPEYGMTNANDFSLGLPLLQPPKGAKRGIFINVNDANAKKSVQSFIELP